MGDELSLNEHNIELSSRPESAKVHSLYQAEANCHKQLIVSSAIILKKENKNP